MVNRGLAVLLAGTGINLALGVLYAWSIFKAAIKDSIEKGGEGAFNWSLSSLNDPYAICCLVFAFAMIPAGRIQDRFGPRITAITGGVLVGLGFVLISLNTEYITWVIGFGVLGGLGIAFGYSSATPAALKWYPPQRTGLIAGIVVAGFGLAPVYIAPLSQHLINTYGIIKAMMFLGIAFFIVVVSLGMMLVSPPKGHAATMNNAKSGQSATGSGDSDISPFHIMRTRMFWLLWVLYLIGAGAGLMVIGSLAGMAKQVMGSNAFLAVAILALGNAGGRVVAGMLSDKFGRKHTLMGIFLSQAIFMFLGIPATAAGVTDPLMLLLLATAIGFNYGANLSLFPSYTKDLWGIKNFGVNYGMVFTSWGVGGFFLSRLSQNLYSSSGSYGTSFGTAGGLLLLGTLMTFLIREGKRA